MEHQEEMQRLLDYQKLENQEQRSWILPLLQQQHHRQLLRHEEEQRRLQQQHREKMYLQTQLLTAATATPAATAATTPAATAPSPAAATDIIAQGVPTPLAKAGESFPDDAKIVLWTDGYRRYQRGDVPGSWAKSCVNRLA